MTTIICYHSERSNSGMAWGHPFYLAVYSNDSVAALKKRIREKVKCPERDFKHWRLGKTVLDHNQPYESQIASSRY